MNSEMLNNVWWTNHSIILDNRDLLQQVYNDLLLFKKMYVLFYVITLLFIKTNSDFLMNLIHIYI